MIFESKFKNSMSCDAIKLNGMGKDGGITWHSWTIQQKYVFFKTVQHKVQLGVARNTGCIVGEKKPHMPEGAYYNVRIFLGINEDLQLIKSSYHGVVRQIWLIV